MKKGKILIVDDNEDILFTLKLLLRPLAESVTLLSDPRELLPVISRTRFDVILLDMNFRRDAVSGKEGFHWLEEILRLDAKAVVIFITAYADTEKPCKPSNKVLQTSFQNRGRTKNYWPPCLLPCN